MVNAFYAKGHIKKKSANIQKKKKKKKIQKKTEINEIIHANKMTANVLNRQKIPCKVIDIISEVFYCKVILRKKYI
jgi:ribonuclease PH